MDKTEQELKTETIQKALADLVTLGDLSEGNGQFNLTIPKNNLYSLALDRLTFLQTNREELSPEELASLIPALEQVYTQATFNKFTSISSQQKVEKQESDETKKHLALNKLYQQAHQAWKALSTPDWDSKEVRRNLLKAFTSENSKPEGLSTAQELSHHLLVLAQNAKAGRDTNKQTSSIKESLQSLSYPELKPEEYKGMLELLTANCALGNLKQNHLRYFQEQFVKSLSENPEQLNLFLDASKPNSSYLPTLEALRDNHEQELLLESLLLRREEIKTSPKLSLGVCQLLVADYDSKHKSLEAILQSYLGPTVEKKDLGSKLTILEKAKAKIQKKHENLIAFDPESGLATLPNDFFVKTKPSPKVSLNNYSKDPEEELEEKIGEAIAKHAEIFAKTVDLKTKISSLDQQIASNADAITDFERSLFVSRKLQEFLGELKGALLTNKEALFPKDVSKEIESLIALRALRYEEFDPKVSSKTYGFKGNSSRPTEEMRSTDLQRYQYEQVSSEDGTFAQNSSAKIIDYALVDLAQQTAVT